VERERRLKGLAPVIGSKPADRDSAEDRIERERRNPLSSATPSKTGAARTDSNTTVGKDTDQPNQSRSGNVPASTNANRTIGSTAAVKGADQQMINASTARPLIFYSVEYSIDLKNAAGDTRNLCVDQFGTVSEFCSDFGFAGATGPMGPAGPMGAQGPAGAVGPQARADAAKWTSFRDFLFDFDKSAIRSNETKQVSDIAAYMKQNPSVQVGIDGHTDPRGTDAFNQGLSERRVNAIREALVTAGVTESRIKAGAFGESQPKCNESTEACWQADRRVEVLIGNSQTASR
jgi:outer membrane protein OmpA-like peptidoglycan-associated protein